MKRDFLHGLQVGDGYLPQEVIDAIMAENGKDIELAKGAASTWEEKYNQAVSDIVYIFNQLHHMSNDLYRHRTNNNHILVRIRNPILYHNSHSIYNHNCSHVHNHYRNHNQNNGQTNMSSNCY